MRYLPFHWILCFIAILLFVASVATASVPLVKAGQTFTCTPTHVWDGDGPIWCEEGPRLRLAGIAAREMDGACLRGHPCPKASAKDARDALVALLGKPVGKGRHGHVLVIGPSLECLSDGSAGGQRTASWCKSPRSGDINCAMVNGGWAVRWDRYWRDHRC
jgi:endonuclease YncB( thermonuclease family)